MSLETKIEKLTKAIEALTAAMQQGEQVAPVEPKETVEPKTSFEPEPEEKAITRDELQAFCMAIVREKPEFKTTLVDLLAKHGVKTISKLSDDAVLDVFDNVKGYQ